MSDAITEAAYVTAPISGEVITLTITTTSARFAIPAAFAGAPTSWIMEGEDADVLWGNSSVSVTYGAAATVTTEAITVNTVSGVRLQNGIVSYYVMPSARRATHFSVDLKDGGTTSYLTIAITGGRL